MQGTSGNCGAEAWGPRGKEIGVDIKPITDEAHDLAHHAFGLTVWSWVELGGSRGACWIQVFDHNDNLFVFHFDKVGSCLHKPLGRQEHPKEVEMTLARPRTWKHEVPISGFQK